LTSAFFLPFAAAVLVSLPLFSLPVVDGKFDPHEGYSHQATIHLYGDSYTGPFYQFNDDYHDTGSLRYRVAGDSLFGLITLPKSFIDNSYGTASTNNSVGWGSTIHSFSDLLNGDFIRLSLKDDSGSTVMRFNVDSLHENSSPTGPGDEFISRGAVTSGDSTWLKNAASSMGYNAATFNEHLEGQGTDAVGDGMSSPATVSSTSYDVVDSLFSDWIFDVQYEFEVDLAAFGLSDFGSIAIDDILAGPSKKSLDYWQITAASEIPDTAVPEPSTYLTLGSFLALAGLAKRRKARAGFDA
jgi:hypothetical protein